LLELKYSAFFRLILYKTTATKKTLPKINSIFYIALELLKKGL